MLSALKPRSVVILSGSPVFFRVKICANTELRARTPIAMGVREMPSNNSTVPKVRRSEASTGSRPHVLRNIPKAAAIIPFVSDLPASAAINVKEKIIIEVNSGGPKVNAMAANGAANRISMQSENVSPQTDEYSAVFIALSGLPFFVNG